MNGQQHGSANVPAWQPLPTKKATREAIDQMLAGNDRALIRALLAIYANQTSDEQTTKDVKHHNGIGFTVHDAHFLTGLAQQAVHNGGRLSGPQMDWLRKLMPKYAGQLTRIAIAKHGMGSKP